MKLIFADDGLLNCTFTIADWLGARLAAGTVRKGLPPKVPVAFTSVTPLVSDVNTIWNGPLIVDPLILVRVTVPLNVLVTRLNARPDAVTEIWLAGTMTGPPAAWKSPKGDSELTEPHITWFVVSTETVRSTQDPFSKWNSRGPGGFWNEIPV